MRHDGCDCSQQRLDLGHDLLGHRTASALARGGLPADSAADVAAMTDRDLLRISTVGPAAVQRIRERLAADDRPIDLTLFESEPQRAG